MRAAFRADGVVTLRDVVIDEITVRGSRCGRCVDALDRLARGEVDVRTLVTARRPLSRVAEALAIAAQPEHTKVLIMMDERIP